MLSNIIVTHINCITVAIDVAIDATRQLGDVPIGSGLFYQLLLVVLTDLTGDLLLDYLQFGLDGFFH